MQRDLPDDLKPVEELAVDAEGALEAAINRLDTLEFELERTRQAFAAVLEALRRPRGQRE